MKVEKQLVLGLAACLCVLGLLFGAATAQDGLYGWWKLDDGPQSEDVAKDSGPRGVDGEISNWDIGGLADDGGVWVNDPQRGMVFSSTGEDNFGGWIAAGFLPMMDLDNDFTWAFWARQDPDETTPGTDIVLGNRYRTGTTDTVPREFIKFTPDRFEYHMNGTGNNDLQYAAGGDEVDILSDDEWYHHAVVKDGDSLTYYRDGELLNERFIVDPMFSPNPLPFGMAGQSDVEVWRGYLSDVRLFESALTQSEVQSIMAGEEPGQKALQAGDADMDLDFDQLDLVKVQVGGKYLTGQAATWGDGDWNGAPGGSPGSPPTGDGKFDQLDIIAALGAGKYLTGPYAAIAAGGAWNDAQTSIVYNVSTGEVQVDAPVGKQLTSVNIQSASSIFTGEPAQNLGGSFDNDKDDNIFKATFGSSFGSLSFGNVAQPGLSQDLVAGDLTVVGSLAGGGDLGAVDLIYVPEPASLLLLGVGLAMVFVMKNRRAA